MSKALDKPVEPQSFSVVNGDDIDLRELWRLIWSGKWLIIGVTMLATICSVIYSLSIPDEYKATVILVPASASSTSSLSKLSGQFGGLASLAGISLGGASGDDKTVVALELIKTWGFLERFITDNNLEVEVFAAKGWDKSSKRLIIDEAIYNEKTASWIKKHGGDSIEQVKPTSWVLFDAIKTRIQASQDKQTGLITLSVEHVSPLVAKKWADLIVIAINRHLQSQDRKVAINSLAYLKERVNKTNVAEMQAIFYQLIEAQTKTLMLTESSDEYVLRTVSPAKIPEVKSKPKRVQVAILGMMIGLLGGVLCRFCQVFLFEASALSDK